MPEENLVRKEVEYFINEKLYDEGIHPSVIVKFTKEVNQDIDKAVGEIWMEEITPKAEEKAKEIIERNRNVLNKLKEAIEVE